MFRFLSPIVLVFSLTYCHNANALDLFITKAFVRQPLSPSHYRQSKLTQPGYLNLIQALKEQPLITVNHYNGIGGTSTISIRGFGSNAMANLRIAVNQLSQSNADMSIANLNQWQPQNLQSIEIIPGSYGVLYGNQAVAGVLLLHPKPIDERKNYLLAGIGSFNTQQYNAQWVKKYRHWSTFLLAGHTRSDNYRQHNQASLWTVQTGLEYHHSNQTDIRLVYHHDHNYSQLPGAITAQQARQDRRQAENNRDWIRSFDDRLSQSGHTILGPHWQFNWASGYSQQQGQGLVLAPYQLRGQTFQLHPKLSGHWTQWNIVTGLDYFQGNYSYDSSALELNSDQQTLGIYTLLQYHLLSSLTVSAGTRWEQGQSHFRTMASEFTSEQPLWVNSVGVQYQMNTDNSIGLRRAGSFRFPKADEISWTYNHTPLQPQTGISYELYYEHRAQQWKLHVQPYCLLLNNEIMYVPFKQSMSFGYNSNLPATQRLGINSWINVMLTPKWQGQIGYDWVDPTLQISGKEVMVPFVSQQHLSLAVAYDLNSHWSIGVSGTAISARYAIGDTDNIGPMQPGYMLLNAYIHYHRCNLDMNLRLNNLTNTRYNDYVVYNSDKHFYFYPAPTFNAYVSVIIGY